MTEHTCLQGPLCEQAVKWLDMSREDVPWCEHDSCLQMIHEDCRACFSEAMEESERWYEHYKTWVQPFLDRQLCPKDMTALKYDGHVGAPGYGIDFSCYCGHLWRRADGFWYSEEDLRHYVPELTVADVI